MQSSLLIRRATRADVPLIVAMLADDFLGARREACVDPLPEFYYQAFAAIQADPATELVVAELEGQVVGTLQLFFLPSLSFQGGTRAQVESVRVAAARRGQGIGREMMLWAIQRARARGCRMLQLTTHGERLDAHRFYERLGFTANYIGMKLML
jgi:GNAT superfamily N-acetyltransferase